MEKRIDSKSMLVSLSKLFFKFVRISDSCIPIRYQGNGKRLLLTIESLQFNFKTVKAISEMCFQMSNKMILCLKFKMSSNESLKCLLTNPEFSWKFELECVITRCKNRATLQRKASTMAVLAFDLFLLKVSLLD